MTEGNPTVEEARAQLVRDYTEDGWEIPVMERALNALIEAVRQEERERYEHDLSTTWKDLALESQRQV